MTSFTVVSVAIMLFERRTDAVARLQTLLLLLPINVVATSFGLLAVAALWRGPAYLLAARRASRPACCSSTGPTPDCAVVTSTSGSLQGLAASLPALTVGSQDAARRPRADPRSCWSPSGRACGSRTGRVTVARHDGAARAVRGRRLRPAVSAAGCVARSDLRPGRAWSRRSPSTTDVSRRRSSSRSGSGPSGRSTRTTSSCSTRLRRSSAARLDRGTQTPADARRRRP